MLSPEYLQTKQSGERESAAGAASTGDPAFRAIDTKATIFSETVLTVIYLCLNFRSDFLICAQSILF